MSPQILGFALVQVSGVIGKGQVSDDYSLSSTDLFHSPAGTVKLTLCLAAGGESSSGNDNCSISSEVVLLDRRISEVVVLDPAVEYSRIEFPDIGAAKQNQEMVTEYFYNRKLGSFLHLRNSPVFHDFEMTSGDGVGGGSISPSGASSGFLSSTTTSLSDDRNSSDSKDKKAAGADYSSNYSSNSAKMKLSMDLDRPRIVSDGDLIQEEHEINADPKQMDDLDPQQQKKKKDGSSRVFYGSRAFF